MIMLNAYNLAAYHAQGLPLRALFSAYSVLPAVTKTEIANAFGVRHEVFCKEKQFEAVNDDGIETDAYDLHSTQLVLRKDKYAIGCTRFVHAQLNTQKFLMPMERFGKGKLDNDLITGLRQSGHRYAEISRLAIHPSFRADPDNHNIKGLFGASGALLSLISGIKSYAHISDTRFMMAIVERRLMASCARLKIPFVSLGDPIEHRGTRYPILFDRDQMHLPPFMALHYDRIHKEMIDHLRFVKNNTPTLGMMNPVTAFPTERLLNFD